VQEILRWVGLDRLDGLITDPRSLELAVRQRMLRFAASFLTLFALLYLTIHLWGGRYRAAAVDLALVLLAFAIAHFARRTGRYVLAQGLIHAAVFVAVLFLSYLTGVYAGAIWWLSVLPLLSMMSGARTVSWVQLLVFAGVVLSFNQLARFTPPEPADGDSANALIALSSLMCTVYTLTYMAQVLRWRDQLHGALARARGEALESAAVKSRFLAAMSHEIRTPLNGVLGSAELLQSRGLSAGERVQMLSLLTQSARSLLTLVNDILDWSKLDVGRVAVEQRPLNLRGLVFESNELFAAQAANKGIELTSSCSPEVPRRFLGDPTRIRQIVNNLVSNAVKFTDHGGVHLHLSLDGVDIAERPNPAAARIARIEVSDSGIGMSPLKIAGLFQAYVQGDPSVAREYGGTGLGLAISQELARLMGGRIEVSSAEGAGSTFTLVLPVQVLEEAPADPGTPGRRSDVLLATASPGLQRHLTTVLNDLRVDPVCTSQLPTSEELAGCHLLMIDSALLSGVDDVFGWLARQASGSCRVVVIAPLNQDAVVGTLPEAMLLYKPVRLSSLRNILHTADAERRRDAKVPDAEAAEAAASPGLVGEPLRGLRVLIAEDNQVNQVVFQAMLAQAGTVCRIVGNGQEALDALASEAVDLVLMDVQMPVLDGLSAVRALRAREAAVPGSRRLPVIAMTANTEPQDVAACMAAGMDDFLPKPFGMAQLTAVLARHARQRVADGR